MRRVTRLLELLRPLVVLLGRGTRSAAARPLRAVLRRAIGRERYERLRVAVWVRTKQAVRIDPLHADILPLIERLEGEGRLTAGAARSCGPWPWAFGPRRDGKRGLRGRAERDARRFDVSKIFGPRDGVARYSFSLLRALAEESEERGGTPALRLYSLGAEADSRSWRRLLDELPGDARRGPGRWPLRRDVDVFHIPSFSDPAASTARWSSRSTT